MLLLRGLLLFGIVATLRGQQTPNAGKAVRLECSPAAGSSPAAGCILKDVNLRQGDSLVPSGRPANDRKLVFQQSTIVSFPAGLFEQFPSIEQLVVANVSLKTLPTGSFERPTKLTALDLSSNHLEALPAGIFHKLAALQELHLQNNSLTNFDGAAIAAGAPLRLLNVSGNGLGGIAAWEALASLRTLEVLDVSDNRLESVFVTKSVRVLRANRNRVSTVSTDASNFIFVLERLELAGNELRDVSGLARFAKLTHLDLSRNHLETVDLGLFRSMRSLAELNLAANRLFTVTTSLGGPSADHPALKVVDLSGNFLTTLPSANASGVASTQKLHLEGNGLVNWELHENALNWPRLTSVTLAHNDWQCEFAEKIQATLAKKPTIAVAGDATTGACPRVDQVRRGKLCCRELKAPYMERLVRVRQELERERAAATTSRQEPLLPSPAAAGGDVTKMTDMLRKALQVVSQLRATTAELETTNRRLSRELEEEQAKTKALQDAASRGTAVSADPQAALRRSQVEVASLRAQLARCGPVTQSRTGQTLIIQ
ncbi:carboxypeptidase N subunit 2-like [Anopheles bellator]|uniref:carboxypeptidase N subunit 2-like n=1 Tax=Anopheles bellator TaxID=139047 RepID=UPI00264A119C|nr:carboxypeptidase N subunit 2-like [Anopheles bellator]